jgi:nitrogen fixation-related uncharacterized protein
LTGEANLLIVWVTFTVMALIGLTAALVWAVRSKQFSNQDAARYLPLKSGIPDEDKPQSRKDEKVHDVSH